MYRNLETYNKLPLACVVDDFSIMRGRRGSPGRNGREACSGGGGSERHRQTKDKHNMLSSINAFVSAIPEKSREQKKKKKTRITTPNKRHGIFSSEDRTRSPAAPVPAWSCPSQEPRLKACLSAR